MKNALLLFLQMCIICFLFGCGSKTMVVLLPDPDGTVGAVTVDNDAGSVTMSQQYQKTTVSGANKAPASPTEMDQDEIEALFFPTIQALPKPPVHFILYCIRNSSELTAESQKVLPQIFATIRERQSFDISVIGHTDTSGNDVYNYTLSQERAEAITALLIKEGAVASSITTTSHGEANPLIPTGDNVNEPKNRRVEVVVR